MARFTMEIAGKALLVDSLFESTAYYCQKYRTDRPPDVTVRVTREELAREQQLLLEEALREGIRPRTFPEPFLERSVIQRKTAKALLDWDILLVHGSTVAVDGRAYLFAAACGTGKSTHTRLWRQVFGQRAVMVNDDKPFLRLEAGTVFACGAPWSGKHGLDTNLTVPLGGICVLERGKENRIFPLTPEEALPLLEAHWDLTPLPAETWKPLIGRVCRCVPVWRMQCTRDPEAAEVAYGHMCP